MSHLQRNDIQTINEKVSTNYLADANDGVAFRSRHSRLYWWNMENVKKELFDFTAQIGRPGIMPFQKEFKKHKRYDLLYAIRIHGGIRQVAKKIGLSERERTSNYVENPDLLEQTLMEFINVYGKPGVMPNRVELEAHGYVFLAQAIKNIGQWAVARRMNLKMDTGIHPKRYWADFAHLEEELKKFIESQGRPGVMPKLSDLKAAGKGYLARPIRNFGGLKAVARRMGLSVLFKHDR